MNCDPGRRGSPGTHDFVTARDLLERHSRQVGPRLVPVPELSQAHSERQIGKAASARDEPHPPGYSHTRAGEHDPGGSQISEITTDAQDLADALDRDE